MTSISAIIPVFNGEKVVVNAIRSALEQKKTVDELVIIDDGSVDGTFRILKTLATDGHDVVILRNEENIGLVRSLVRAISVCRGDLILRLDADDVWLPDHAAAIEELACRCPDASLFAARAARYTTSGVSEGVSKKVSDRDIRAALMWDNPLIHSAVGFRRNAYFKVGGYRDKYLWEDYDLWIRLLRVGAFAFSDRISVNYTVANASLSHVPRRRAVWERSRLQLVGIRVFGHRHPVAAVGNCAGLAARILSSLV